MRPALALVLLPALALAGQPHTREYAATVRGLAVVKSHAFDDRLASLDDDGAPKPKLQGGEACEVRLGVGDPFFKKEQRVYASPPACQRLRVGARVDVQYLGLATAAQFVSMKLDGVWYSLPLMRRTASTSPWMRACLAGPDAGEPACAPREGPAL
jgi:hypothetical protein